MKHVGGILALLLALHALPASAQDDELGYPVDELVTDAFIEETRQWLEVPVVRITVKSRNAEAADVGQNAIDELDKQWRAERSKDDQPLITSVLSNPLSSYLTRIQANSLGLYSEIFVMDKNGLNAGQSAITSDYWQGDEDKFQKTFSVGKGAVFLGEPELNEDTATWRGQINLTVHSESGEPIGAATVEVNLTELARRKTALGS